MREGSLMGQRFDARRLKLEGEAFPVAENVSFSANFSLGTFSVSENGVLIYRQGQSSQASWQVNWYDRSGKPAGNSVVNGNGPSLSPDGKTMAFQVASYGGDITLWLLDIARQVKTRFSFVKPLAFAPVWSPDGKQIVFGAWVPAGSNGGVYIKPSDGSLPERLLYEGQAWPVSWSRDGRYLLMRNVGRDGLPQLWAMSMQGERKAFPVVQAPSFHVGWGDFSPDGKWITYDSDESGKTQVYVAPFPGPGGRWQVSTDGGVQPLWRGNGIFFLNDGKLWVSNVQEQASGVRLGAARVLFSAPYQGNPGHWYDVSRDGKRFVINVSTQPQDLGEPLNLLVNWTAELKK
jgi:Tol biopolymer transport system component